MFLVRVLSRLPFCILYFISDFLFFMSFYVIKYRRKMVQKNLRNSFPEKAEDEIYRIEKTFYKNLCDYAVEMLKLLTINKEDLSKRMVYNAPEIAATYATQQQSVIILTAHQFNWEWLLATGGFKFPMNIDFVYQKVNSEFFEKISMACRTRFGAYPIKRDEVAREMIRRKNIVRGIAMVSDQYPGHGRDKKHLTKFLNQDSVFFLGTNQVAIMTQYPVFYYEIVKIRRGYYETNAIQIGTPPYGIESVTVIENYVREVEKSIRRNPSNWLWSHNRWKKRHLKNS
jgi:Kdo2-lipid IVA lauroyltransferase/acyltransferase